VVVAFAVDGELLTGGECGHHRLRACRCTGSGRALPDFGLAEVLRIAAERASPSHRGPSCASTRTVPSIMVTLICTPVEADVESGTDGDQSPVVDLDDEGRRGSLLLSKTAWLE